MDKVFVCVKTALKPCEDQSNEVRTAESKWEVKTSAAVDGQRVPETESWSIFSWSHRLL